jgi:hypothetical protein
MSGIYQLCTMMLYCRDTRYYVKHTIQTGKNVEAMKRYANENEGYWVEPYDPDNQGYIIYADKNRKTIVRKL